VQLLEDVREKAERKGKVIKWNRRVNEDQKKNPMRLGGREGAREEKRTVLLREHYHGVEISKKGRERENSQRFSRELETLEGQVGCGGIGGRCDPF